jgi:Pentapeptide repeats (9 copies)
MQITPPVFIRFEGARMLVHSGKTVTVDQKFDADETDSHYANYVFLRLVAMRRRFERVDFRYSFFDACYLRDCEFDSCDFTGCRFVNTQLPGAKFSGCKFDYATFEKTNVDPIILNTECPGHENLKSRFARTLRTNFQQLGDASAVNKAMRVELDATEIHLKKAWQSNESYYRSHHPGVWGRIEAFLAWIKFKALDYIWGNGESIVRLLISILITVTMMAIFDAISYRDPSRVGTYVTSYGRAFEVFIGTLRPAEYAIGYLTLVTSIRLIAVGFFLSIIIKRFNRR